VVVEATAGMGRCALGLRGWVTLLDDLEKADLPMAQVKEAMESIDYGKG
jgi:hypothetical protein